MNENDFINFAVGIKDNVSYCENIKINISFLEAIKGCSKEIKYKKKNFKNEITEIKVKLNIKPGIENGAYLLQKTAGSYNETTRKYNDIKFIFEVEKHPILNRNGYNIESSIHISLLQALRGDTIEIDTINGLQKINLKPLLKNKDRVILKEKGIILDSIKGDHIITVNVTYPDDVQPLINLLEGQK